MRRAVKVSPQQLQLKQTGRGETGLLFLWRRRDKFQTARAFVPLVRFLVALKPVRRAKCVAEKTRVNARAKK